MFMYTNMCIYIYIYTHRCICHSNITNKLASVPPPSQALLAAAAALNRLSQKICLSSLLVVVVLLVLVLVLVLVLLYITYIYIYTDRERETIYIYCHLSASGAPRRGRRAAALVLRGGRREARASANGRRFSNAPRGPPGGKH